jgi:hypothetical protein
MKSIIALTLVVALQASLSLAASFPTSISRQALNVRLPSDRLSVGVTYEEIERTIDLDRGDNVILDAASASLYVGYDVVSWFTLFATLGAAELEGDGDVATDSGLKVSGGVSAYLWEVDILEPIFMAGRFSIKPTAELSRYASDSSLGDTSWYDLTVALPFGYERFDRYPESAQGIATSLALYVGPALSYVTGTAGTAGGDVDFEGDEMFGVMGGLDLYFSPAVSLGVEFSVFDELSIGGSLRFHL